MQTHWYTHIDAPLHQVADGKTLNDFPLDYLFGKAVMLDVSYVGPDEPSPLRCSRRPWATPSH